MSKQLSNDDKLLASLVTAIDQTVLFLSPQRRVERCTPGAADWLLYSLLLGRSLAELFPAELYHILCAAMDRAQSTTTPQRLELQMLPEQLPVWWALGLRRPGVWQIAIVAYGAGRWLLVFEDVTEDSRRTPQDRITGTYTRRVLMTVLRQSIAQAQRYDWPCSLMLLEIDGLGSITDLHGRDTGDHLLRQLVEAIQRQKRSSDFFARYEDDCFALLLPETGLGQGQLVAERVRRLVAALRTEGLNDAFGCTVSIGITALLGPDDTVDAILARAGENLGIARESGGNRCEGDG